MRGIASKLEWLSTLCRHSGVGLWDAIIHNGDAAHAKSRWTWSPEFRRLLGYSSEQDFPNLMTSWSDLLHPDDVGPTFDAFGKTVQTGVPYSVQYRLKVRDGSYRWFQATGGVVKGISGKVRRASGSLVDIHVSKSLEVEQHAAVEVLLERMSALAAGKLDGRIADMPERFAALRTDFNRALDGLCDVMGTVSTTSHAVRARAEDIRAASDNLSMRTEQQAASLEETAAAMHEITVTVRETASNAVKVTDVIRELRSHAEESGGVVRDAVAAMNGIERSSSEISEIIAVIDGIAFQTNLLALNAGVEAARAGDAGKGFAVVASEVRALAQRSADAAKDVKSMINSSATQVGSGVSLVAQTGEALTGIIRQIGTIDSLVSDIAAAAAQQAAGLQQVNDAVTEMDGVTQQNAAMVEQATAAARSLTEETENMAQQVSRFQLSDRGAARYASPVHQLQARAGQFGGRRDAGTEGDWIAA